MGKKNTEPQTFSVIFPLDVSKGRIIINTNNSSKPSKKELIELASKFHSQNNITEAEAYYQFFINEGYTDYKVFSNYGALLKDLGNLRKAEIYTRKSIELNCDFPDSYYNLGIILLDLGKSEEAELSFNRAIKLNPSLIDAHYNLGVIFAKFGKLKQAKYSFKKSIELNPAYMNAHNNLGIVLINLGKLEEAEFAIRKSIELNPDSALAHNNLGILLNTIGKFSQAEISSKKAIQLNPDFADAHLSLGNIFKNLGKSNSAFDAYIKVIQLQGDNPLVYASITEFLKNASLFELDRTKLRNILHILLDRNDIAHKDLFNSFNYCYKNEILSHLILLSKDLLTNNLLKKIINERTIIQAMKKIIFMDYEFEKVFTNIRSNILDLINNRKIYDTYYNLDFITALAEQCFLNEFVYSITNEEIIAINKLINKYKDTTIDEYSISILACYLPLFSLLDKIPSLKEFNSSNHALMELLNLQIKEPMEEIELSKNIRKIGSIKDNISKLVKSQYEENPYPRWRYAFPYQETDISIVEHINSEIKPNQLGNIELAESTKILVAGCGTGNQILHTQKYNNCSITCIDLSLTSLSYAQRKINELGISNVELIQMDILDVHLLNTQFDLILCGGVLHHMKKPLDGLKALLDILKINGFMKLGLYSQLARRDIVKIKEYISSFNLQPNIEGIRKLREDIMADKIENLGALKQYGSFYSTSEFRDLCFHVQEHRFTIEQLMQTFISNELQFLGFLLPQRTKTLYNKHFPKDQKLTNLNNWAIFEEKYPDTFRSMYQFWICKNKI